MEKIKTIIGKIPIHNRKFIISGIIISFLIILLGVMVFIQFSRNKESKDPSQQTQSVEKKKFFAALNFSESILKTRPQQTQSVSIVADVGANSLGSITFMVRYDPSKIINVLLTQDIDGNSPLSSSLEVVENFVAQEKGIAVMTLSLKKNALEQRGSGSIAKLSFETAPGFQGSTALEFGTISISSSELTPNEEFMPQVNSVEITSQ